jgi:uncharacterized membrane protein
MDKRLTTIGIILLFVGVLLLVGASQTTLSALPNANNTLSERAYLPANTIGYYALPVSAPSFVGVGFNSTAPIDFYIVNSSAYEKMKPLVEANASLRNLSVALEGNGIIDAMWHASKGIFPYESDYGGLFPAPNYSIENTTVLINDTYYLLFQNEPATNQTLVLYSIIVTPASALGLSSIAPEGFGIIGAFLVLVGISLTVFGLIRKGNPQETVRDREVERIFAEQEKKQRLRKKDVPMRRSKHKTVVRKRRRR